ncbi:MAG: response regulator, partial [Deltaproteobacteria bacterium]|nr:response regulator [Deltaproteobacteria bacterium]
MGKLYLKLTTKISLIILTILIILMTISSIIIVNISSSILTKEAKERLDETAVFYSKINSMPLFRLDYYALENNTKELLSDEDIIYAEVYDFSGNKLTGTSETYIEKPFDNILHVKKDIFKSTLNLGYIRIGLSLDATNQNIAFLTQFLLSTMSLTVFIIISILVLLIRRIVNKPLSYFIDSVALISSGNLDYQVNIQTKDEIGTLSNNFNFMTQRLKESINLIKNIVDSIPSIIIGLDKEGIITHWNKAAEDFCGILSKDINGTNLWANKTQFDKYKNDYFKVINRKRKIKYLREEFPDYTSGDICYKDIFIFPILNEANNDGAVLIATDYTDLVKTENQLMHSQKMKAVGTLASGIAHDFNNILGGITSPLSMIKFKLNSKKGLSNEKLKDYLKLIETSSNRATSVLEQLSSISRKEKLTIEHVDLNKSVEHVLKICTVSFDKSIDIRMEYYDKPVVVNADPVQIEQVILNLCINASHAMTIMLPKEIPFGGTLTISFREVTADIHFCSSHPDAIKETVYWQVYIKDTGIGMDQEMMTKIFEPFFTTKKKGIGTELGLSTVNKIIKQHNGFIDIESKVGKGTTMNIYLPAMEEEFFQRDCKKLDKIHHGKGLVFVVDDDDNMRNITKEILQDCGYDIITAEDGEIALSIFNDRHKEIDLVVLDVVMPKMSGKEVFINMKKIFPEIKVLFTSGHTEGERIDSIMKLDIEGFIKKPFTLFELSESVWKAMNP